MQSEEIRAPCSSFWLGQLKMPLDEKGKDWGGCNMFNFKLIDCDIHMKTVGRYL